MSVIARWWHINDGAGDPQADYWTQAEVQAEHARRKGAEVVEYVPADQLRGAVAITDERIELAAKRLRLEYGWKTGDPDHTYRAIAKAMLEDAFGGQSE